MNMKMIYKGIAAVAAALLAGACTAGYMDINKNPYGVTDDEMQRDGYAVRAALIGISNGVISPDVNTTQFTECLLGGTMGGYMADGNAGFANTISNYNPTDNWTNVFMKSSWIIPTVYANYRLLHQVTDDPVLWAVGDIVKVAAMHRVTDTYGPIPYSKIGQNGEINVPYDSQMDVYKTMFSELDAAVAVLMPERLNNFSPSADVVYGGVVDNWIKFANSLKLRLAMRISYADPELSKEMAESAVNHEVGVMTSNADNAVFSSWGTDGNPINRSVEYNMVTIHEDGSSCGTQSGDSHAAADIVSYMNGYNDPRRANYFTAVSGETGTEYHGVRNGITVTEAYLNSTSLSRIKCTNNDDLLWMTPAEAWFLKAEYYLRTGDEAQAKSCYEEGVRVAFSVAGASGADSYLADDENTPGTFTDVVNSGNSYNTDLTDCTVAWEDGGQFETNFEKIITQKWIAIFPLGVEAWSEHRRTGYPRLMPVVADKSGGGVDVAQGARRLPYPVEEYQQNNANLQAAIQQLDAEQTNGNRTGDQMGTRVWWDCKPYNN